MKKLNQTQMLEKINKGKYHISLIDGSYFISSGKGQKMTFKSITNERAQEWLALGAELVEL